MTNDCICSNVPRIWRLAGVTRTVRLTVTKDGSPYDFTGLQTVLRIDRDNSDFHYEPQFTVEGDDNNIIVFTWAADKQPLGDYTIEVTVTDGSGNKDRVNWHGATGVRLVEYSNLVKGEDAAGVESDSELGLDGIFTMNGVGMDAYEEWLADGNEGSLHDYILWMQGPAREAAEVAEAQMAVIQSRADDDHTTAGSDHTRAAADHTTATGDHTRAEEDHTRAISDHTRAAQDHTSAVGDHMTAGQDHLRAEADHTTAGSDHTRAESDHATAASDHSTAASDHTKAGQDSTRAGSDHDIAVADHAQAEADHTRAESDHTTAAADHTTAASDHTTASSDHTTAAADHTQAVADHAVMAGYDTRLGNVEDEVSQLGQEVDEKATKETVIIKGQNLLNPATLTHGYINKDTGAYAPLASGTSTDTRATDYIPIDSRGLYCACQIGYGAAGGWAVYNSNKQYIRGNKLVASVAFQEGDAYVRFTISVGANYTDSQQINVGTTLITPIVPYVEPTTKTTLTDPGLKIQPGQIEDGVVATETIEDSAVNLEKVSFSEEVRSKNILDTSTLVTEKWLASDGSTPSVTNAYGYFPFIPVSPGTNYHLSNKEGYALSSRSDAYIVFYKEDKSFISSTPSNTTDITTPINCAYIGVSVVVASVTNMQPMIEEGEARTEYQPYFAPYLAIDPDVIIFPDGSVTTKKIANGAVTQDKIANGVILPAKPQEFGCLKSSGAIGQNEGITTTLTNIKKDFRILATIKGAISSVSVGLSRLGTYGQWLEIDSTKIKVKSGVSGTTTTEFSHGLTLGTITKVIISKTATQEDFVHADIRLIDDYGNMFSQNINWYDIVGSAFVYNNGTGTLDAELSFMPADIIDKIWVFGDSYLAYPSDARWPHYTIKWGYTSYLINAIGGENATEALADLSTILGLGARPSYLVWCLGMNNGSDSSGQVNPTWLSVTNQVISICEEYGITPVFATIPSVPTQIHTKLNEWVRASGYKYIDFASAVETEGTYTWRGWGTSEALLSNDQVHPTAHGAVELACRALQDFPELTI